VKSALIKSPNEIRSVLRALAGGHGPAGRERILFGIRDLLFGIGSLVMGIVVLDRNQDLGSPAAQTLPIAVLVAVGIAFLMLFVRFQTMSYYFSETEIVFRYARDHVRWVVPRSTIASVDILPTHGGFWQLRVREHSGRTRWIWCTDSMIRVLEDLVPLKHATAYHTRAPAVNAPNNGLQGTDPRA
jgi:hypothetical protein